MKASDFRGVFWAYVIGLLVVVFSACVGARPALYGTALAECSNRVTSAEAESCCVQVAHTFAQDPTFCHVVLIPADAGPDRDAEAQLAAELHRYLDNLPNPYDVAASDAAADGAPDAH